MTTQAQQRQITSLWEIVHELREYGYSINKIEDTKTWIIRADSIKNLFAIDDDDIDSIEENEYTYKLRHKNTIVSLYKQTTLMTIMVLNIK